MWKLLPRHMEIIGEIDKRVYSLPILLPLSHPSTPKKKKYIYDVSCIQYLNFKYEIVYVLQFIAMIRKARPDLESKLPSMCILDNNPQKPVVRMANLCVVSAHTVRGLFFGKSAQRASQVAYLAESFSFLQNFWYLGLFIHLVKCHP